MLRLLITLLICLFMSAAQAQTVPAWKIGPPPNCAERGGWNADGLCLKCPNTHPERTEEPALGNRACFRPAGWKRVEPSSMKATNSAPMSARYRGRYRCATGTLRGGRCYRCPSGTLQEGIFCKMPYSQSWDAALRVNVTTCRDGNWKEHDGNCYTCRGDLLRANGSEPACQADPTGMVRSKHQANYVNNPRRSSVEAQLGAFLGQGAATASERTSLMQEILLQEWKSNAAPHYDTLIWLKPDGRGKAQLSGGYVRLKRGNPHSWHCAPITATAHRSQPAPPPQHIIVLTALRHRLGWHHDLLAWLEPLPTPGISAGHPQRMLQGAGLIWEIGTPPTLTTDATTGFYRLLGPLTLHSATDCAELRWP